MTETKPKKRISVAAGKSKGRRLQQWVRDEILSRFPSLEPDDCRSTSMGAGGEDVQLSPAARREIPISVECKAYAKQAVYGQYEQAVSNCPANAEPVLFVKADRKKPLAVIDAKYFLDLMKKVRNG